jgi:hypothetical protein
MRIIRSRDYTQSDFFIRQQFLERPRHAHFRIFFLRPRSPALQYASQFHPLHAANHRRVKRLSRHPKTNQSHSHHGELLDFRRVLYRRNGSDLQSFADISWPVSAV